MPLREPKSSHRAFFYRTLSPRLTRAPPMPPGTPPSQTRRRGRRCGGGQGSWLEGRPGQQFIHAPQQLLRPIDGFLASFNLFSETLALANQSGVLLACESDGVFNSFDIIRIAR